MKTNPEISWSLMHPTALDPAYFRRVIREAEAGNFRVDSFEVCARCHSPLGGLDGLLPADVTAGLDVDRAAIDANIALLREILAAAHDSGRPLYYWHREVTTAPGLLRLHPELLDENGEFDLLGEPFEGLLRAKIAGAFESVPELDGIVLTLTEAEYSVLHNSRPEKYPPAEVVRRISEVFCDELERRGKRFILRSFGSIDADYRSILAGAELLAGEGRRFEIETKITPFDFDPFLPENPYLVHTGELALGAEFDLLGEFLGAGRLPAEDVEGTLRRVAAARRAGVDRYAIRLDRGGRSVFDTHPANLEACMAAIVDPEITAETFRDAVARRRRWTPELRRALPALAKRGFEAVLKTHFVHGNVIFHVNPPGPTLGILKASGFFAFFSENAPLRHLAGIWSILADRSTGTRAELLAEKEEAVALAAAGIAELERLRPLLPAAEYERLRRLWRTLLGAAESVTAFCRVVAAYFDDMERKDENHLRLTAAMRDAARIFSRIGADADSDAPAYALPLADAVKLLPEEFAAEFRARHDPRWRDAEDLVISGSLTDEWRCGHAMHASNTRIADGVPCRAAGNRLFPNGALAFELHGGSDAAPRRLLLTGRGRAAVAVDGRKAGEFELSEEPAVLPLPPGTAWVVEITRAGGGDYPEVRAVAVAAGNTETNVFRHK